MLFSWIFFVGRRSVLIRSSFPVYISSFSSNNTLFSLLFWLGSVADPRPHTLTTTTLFKYIAAATRKVLCSSLEALQHGSTAQLKWPNR